MADRAQMPSDAPASAMVLAAGLGTRMRPITDHTPKPLVEVAGRSLLDRALDALVAAGVERAVVNVHHLAHRIEAHLDTRSDLAFTVSDEREALLDSGGGVARAVSHLDDTFFVLNADTFWVEADGDGGSGDGGGNGRAPSLQRMAAALDGNADIVMLLVPHGRAVGFAGRGDFFMDEAGHLERRGERDRAPFVYAGALLMRRSTFADAPDGAFSLNLLFDRAIASGRLKGVVMDGLWLHVGTPDAIKEAETALEAWREAA